MDMIHILVVYPQTILYLASVPDWMSGADTYWTAVKSQNKVKWH